MKAILLLAFFAVPFSACAKEFFCAGTCEQTVVCEVLVERNATDFYVSVKNHNGELIAEGEVDEYLEFEFSQPGTKYKVTLSEQGKVTNSIDGNDISVPCKCKCPPKD